MNETEQSLNIIQDTTIEEQNAPIEKDSSKIEEFHLFHLPCHQSFGLSSTLSNNAFNVVSDKTV